MPSACARLNACPRRADPEAAGRGWRHSEFHTSESSARRVFPKPFVSRTQLCALNGGATPACMAVSRDAVRRVFVLVFGYAWRRAASPVLAAAQAVRSAKNLRPAITSAPVWLASASGGCGLARWAYVAVISKRGNFNQRLVLHMGDLRACLLLPNPTFRSHRARHLAFRLRDK